MDSNGNGIHDAGDRVKKNGITVVDIYINTGANRDGSAAVCDNDNPDVPGLSPLQLFSIGLGFKAVGGTVSWGAFTPAPAAREVVLSPNPLNPSGAMAFTTTRAGSVRVRLFDVRGRLVRTIAETPMSAGRHELAIDGNSDREIALRSGIYFYRLESVDGSYTGRLTISR